MRSPKNRSRSKNNNNNNRNRSGVNVVNRVFDSSGPEGKVRGTPQQVIEKYGQLARDAQLSNDRVAAENFRQHGEHYIRLLGEAQREMDAKREQQEREHRERQQQREEQQQNRSDNQQRHADQQNRRDDNHGRRDENQPGAEEPRVTSDPANTPQPDVLEPVAQVQTGLVETPEETKPKRKPRQRKPRVEKAEPEQLAPDQPETPEAAE